MYVYEGVMVTRLRMNIHKKSLNYNTHVPTYVGYVIKILYYTI